MPGSPVDQACLASSDKMFPLNHHTGANNTFKYMRELSDSPARVIDVSRRGGKTELIKLITLHILTLCVSDMCDLINFR